VGGRLDLARALAGVVVALAAMAAPTRVEAQVGRREVVAVYFEGNESFPADSLARAIVTRPSECRSAIFSPFCWLGADFAVKKFYLPERQIVPDLARLQIWYQRRGFREIQVDTARFLRPDGGAEMTFRVQEGTPVLTRSINVVGADDAVDPLIFDNLPLKPGERLSTIALDATRDSLATRLADRGYAHVFVLHWYLIPSDDLHVADVTFDIDTGPLTRYGPIEVVGNQALSDATVRNALQFREGGLYRRNQLIEGQARLFGLEIIRTANVIADLGSDANPVVPLTVTVNEGQAYRVRYGAGLTTAECFDVESRWSARNFWGGGRTLQVRGRLSNILAPQFHDILCRDSGDGAFGELNWLASVDFVQPWIFSPRNSFSASVFGERQSLPDVFIREAVGLNLSLTRAIGPRTPLTLSYRPELSRLDAAELLFCTGFLACTAEDIDILGSANRIAPVGINFTRNLANNLLNPTRGYSVVVDLEHAAPWTGSHFRYDRVVVEGTKYSEISSVAVWAGRVRGGWIGAGSFSALDRGGNSVDLVHPQKRFYAGGANSVRGFSQSRLGPGVLQVLDPLPLLSNRGANCSPETVIDLSCDASPLGNEGFISRPTGGTRVLEANLELRFGVGRSFEVVTFADVGQVWAAVESVSLSDLEVTPGVGVRFLSPIGPIRVDLAYRFRGAQELSVVTTQIRPFDPLVDDPDDPRDGPLSVNGEFIPYVRTNNIALLTPRVLFGESSAFSLRRFQIHLSIGQAF
jgi:outer membrane protein assembly factor BamA